jgi:hypothetical protein
MSAPREAGCPILAFFVRVGCHGPPELSLFNFMVRFVKMESPTLFRKRREIGWGSLRGQAGRMPAFSAKYTSGPTAIAIGPQINP